MHFRLNFIQPLTFSFLTCECGYGLDTFGTHLTCLFEGQRIATHEVIKDVMYALTQKNGHNVWKKWWYAFTSGASLRANLYMTHED